MGRNIRKREYGFAAAVGVSPIVGQRYGLCMWGIF
jgi:hypothetical protein